MLSIRLYPQQMPTSSNLTLMCSCIIACPHLKLHAGMEAYNGEYAEGAQPVYLMFSCSLACCPAPVTVMPSSETACWE